MIHYYVRIGKYYFDCFRSTDGALIAFKDRGSATSFDEADADVIALDIGGVVVEVETRETERVLPPKVNAEAGK